MTTALAEKQQAQIIQWSRDEVATIRDTVAKSATDSELKMFLHLSQTYGLDPFVKEIWFIKAGGQPVIMTSRDGYLKIAIRDKSYDGLVSDVVYEGDSFQKTPDGVTHSYGQGKRGAIIGAYALVYRNGIRFPAYVFAPFRDYNKGNNIWRQYPHAMILKVAESMALKRAFSLSGLVTREEYDAEDVGTPKQNDAVDAEIIDDVPQSPASPPARATAHQGATKTQPLSDGAPSVAMRKKSLYDGYLAVCDNVPAHAQNAMMKVTEWRGSKDWTEQDLKLLTVDLYKRQGKMKTNIPEKAQPELEEPEESAAEYFDRLAQEGPTLPFGESMRDTNPDIDQAEHF